jgi:hypothetical protein
MDSCRTDKLLPLVIQGRDISGQSDESAQLAEADSSE